MNLKEINKNLTEMRGEIPYQFAHETFLRIYRDYDHKFLLESKDVSHIYGRLSLIGVDPVLKISGKNDRYCVEVLNERGEKYMREMGFSGSEVSGEIPKSDFQDDESNRSKRKNIVQIIRDFLEKFKLEEKTLLGLYGAFSYDFIRLFEDLPEDLPDNEVNDFTLFLYDSFVFFDHLKEKTEVVVFRENEEMAKAAFEDISGKIERQVEEEPVYEISDPNFKLSQAEYEDLVKVAKKYTEEGEFFEVVFSNILKAKFEGDPYALYLKYREINPSPYLFYFDFGDEELVGASPEMMVRVENRVAHMRPISGTAKRGNDPIEDHENMLELLADEKERAELDMLIDLGRNDLSRISKPGIKISDYRFVEKYSRVMHTVAHLSGELRDDVDALDALIACLNAGTLTGAPKVAAMSAIEKHEKERRGYYGGAVGYLTFSGEMDTGIIIRTAHIKGDELKFQVGATLLYDSVPEKEYQETINKAQAFLDTFLNPQES
jgi:anthranilate synthase